MIVCICKSVRERDIRNLVDSSDGALRMRDLRDRLGVSSECGKCARRAHCLLKASVGAQTANAHAVSGKRAATGQSAPVVWSEPTVAL
nr:(2Fe-2S)-binding protein [Thioalkalivibrio sp. ALJT]